MTVTQIERVTTAETALPVPLASLKKHVAIDATEIYYDDMLTDMQLAAVEYIESKTRLTLRQATFDVFLSELPHSNDPLYLPLWPISSITSFAYVDRDGATQAITPASLQQSLKVQPAALYPAVGDDWPDVQEDNQRAVTIRLVAGGLAVMPAMVTHAIKLLVAHWFRNREAVLVGSVSSDLAKALDSLMVQVRRNHWQSFGVYQ